MIDFGAIVKGTQDNFDLLPSYLIMSTPSSVFRKQHNNEKTPLCREVFSNVSNC